MEELSYSLHLGNDKYKSKRARRTAKMNDTNTTSFNNNNNNAIQNHQQLSKVDKHNLRNILDENDIDIIQNNKKKRARPSYLWILKPLLKSA